MTLTVGDKVRVVNPTHTRSLRMGAVLTVTGVSHDGAYVSTDEIGPRWSASRFEKVEPEPKFRVGDEVQWSSRKDTTYRIVKTAQEESEREYDFRIENSQGGCWAYERELTLVSASTPFVLRTGDRIKNLKTGREGRVYPGPVSGDLKVYDVRPPYRDGVPAAAVEEYEEHYPGTYDFVSRGCPF